MPIIIPLTSGSGTGAVSTDTATTTVADMLTCAKGNLQASFSTLGATDQLIRWANDVQQTMLSARRWDWMLSVPKRFVTEVGQTDYWIGPTGSQSAGQVDTGLDLADVRMVKEGSALDRSDQLMSPLNGLWRTLESPSTLYWQNTDGSFKIGIPAEIRNDRTTPNVVSIYPPANEGNEYQLVPATPQLSSTSGGALAARTYFVRCTFVDSDGNEGRASTPAARQHIPAGNLLVVSAPQPAIPASTSGILYDHYNVYVGTTEGEEVLQNASPQAITDDWTEPTGGLIDGAAPPSDSAIEPLRGYVIEFRYWRKHTVLSATTDILFIPDEWSYVFCYGLTARAAIYLKRPDDVATYNALFTQGLRAMKLDQNPWPAKGRFVAPDPTTFFERRL